MKLRKLTPSCIANQLWGNRPKWGKRVHPNDSCWKEWERVQEEFYFLSQRKGIGARINNAGYKIVSELDLAGKVVMEFGPADLLHCKYWKQNPAKFIVVDIRQNLIERSNKILKERGIVTQPILINREGRLPIEDESVDVAFSFYSLEHLFPLMDNLLELKRILKPGGLFVGAVPAEGGLGWGVGRWLTTRRWFLKNTNIDPDKVICWEHPNFCDEIMSSLDQVFTRVVAKKWPFPLIDSIDLNLIQKFYYRKQ